MDDLSCYVAERLSLTRNKQSMRLAIAVLFS